MDDCLCKSQFKRRRIQLLDNRIRGVSTSLGVEKVTYIIDRSTHKGIYRPPGIRVSKNMHT